MIHDFIYVTEIVFLVTLIYKSKLTWYGLNNLS